jgi:hypothetical protein
VRRESATTQVLKKCLISLLLFFKIYNFFSQLSSSSWVLLAVLLCSLFALSGEEKIGRKLVSVVVDEGGDFIE